MASLTKEEDSQISFLPDQAKEKARRLDKTYDAIHARYGMASITRGSSMRTHVDAGKKYKAQMETSGNKHASNKIPTINEEEST